MHRSFPIISKKHALIAESGPQIVIDLGVAATVA